MAVGCYFRFSFIWNQGFMMLVEYHKWNKITQSEKILLILIGEVDVDCVVVKRAHYFGKRKGH